MHACACCEHNNTVNNIMHVRAYRVSRLPCMCILAGTAIARRLRALQMTSSLLTTYLLSATVIEGLCETSWSSNLNFFHSNSQTQFSTLIPTEIFNSNMVSVAGDGGLLKALTKSKKLPKMCRNEGLLTHPKCERARCWLSMSHQGISGAGIYH